MNSSTILGNSTELESGTLAWKIVTILMLAVFCGVSVSSKAQTTETAILESTNIAAGNWIKKEQRIRGSWSIEARDDGHYLMLDEQFRTRNAPDLQLILSKLSVEEVNGNNALQSSLIIAVLESPRGGQSYRLPENYTDYKTLLLHCVEYSKLWGAAQLRLHFAK